MGILYDRIIRGLGRRLGLDIQRNAGWTVARLRSLCEPGTLIDIGVGAGTPVLYRAFPQASLLLVDPLVEFEGSMRRALAEREGAFELVALAAEPGEAHLHLGESLSNTSMSIRTDRPTSAARLVSTNTLDQVVSRHELPPPYLLKIDTEGHELEVVRGGSDTLRETACVIAELSISERFASSYTFTEAVAELDAYGFVLSDMLYLKRNPDGSARLADAVFTRK